MKALFRRGRLISANFGDIQVSNVTEIVVKAANQEVLSGRLVIFLGTPLSSAKRIDG